MDKRTFIIKILEYIAIILLLLTNLVVAIKKWHSFSTNKCLIKRYFWGRHSLAELNVPLFYYMQIFLLTYKW